MTKLILENALVLQGGGFVPGCLSVGDDGKIDRVDIHVHPVNAKLVYKAKGIDKLAIITDSNIGAGLKPERYTFPGWDDVEIREGDSDMVVIDPDGEINSTIICGDIAYTRDLDLAIL